jgi:hypothetical protein
LKTITDELSKKQIYALTFGTNAMGLFLAFAILWAIVWFCSGSSLIGFAAAVAIPPYLLKRSADKKIRVINKVLDDTYAKTMSCLENIDYYYYNSNGSIAVDAKNGQIAYIKILRTMEISSAVIINAADIIEFFYYDPGMTTTKYYGRDMAVAQGVLIDNIKEKILRGETMGLHVKVNNLHTPKIIMFMTGKIADHWTLILKRLIDRSLEPTNSPTLLP